MRPLPTAPAIQAPPSVDVLHIEDDDAYALLVRRWLAPQGLRTHRVGSRAELYDYLAKCERPPRCLLIDLGLSDSAGLSLCDEIKTSPALQGLPIVLFTGAQLPSNECLEHDVLHLVRKSGGGAQELLATVTAVIKQHDRSQGIIDAGDLRLDPREREVSINGQVVAKLAPGPFSALLLLVKSSPQSLGDEPLYAAFIARRPHQTDDMPPGVHAIVREYIYRLRHDLGPAGARITRQRREGYAYRP